MQKFLGLLLLMVGLAMAALWIPARDGSRQLAQVVEVTERGIARVSDPSAPYRNRTETPGQQAGGPAASTALQGSEVLASAQPTSSTRSTLRMPPASIAARPSSQSGVAGRLIATSSAADPQPRLGSAQPTTDDAYYALVRDLQRELRRLGCYWGEIDGSWGPGSKRAITTLMERVNASLPVDQPDYILLALARSQADQACRMPCPPDQLHMSDTGQCLPRALLTQSTRDQAEGRSDAALVGQTVATGGAAAPLPGQMSIGGPRPDGTVDGAPSVPPAATARAPRPPPAWYRQPRRDNSWKRRVFGDLYDR